MVDLSCLDFVEMSDAMRDSCYIPLVSTSVKSPTSQQTALTIKHDICDPSNLFLMILDGQVGYFFLSADNNKTAQTIEFIIEAHSVSITEYEPRESKLN